jgi:hypothetical protein
MFLIFDNFQVFAQNYGLAAAGTAHGLVIVDTVQLSLTLAKCTLNAQGNYTINLYKTFSSFF